MKLQKLRQTHQATGNAKAATGRIGRKMTNGATVQHNGPDGGHGGVAAILDGAVPHQGTVQASGIALHVVQSHKNHQPKDVEHHNLQNVHR